MQVEELAVIVLDVAMPEMGGFEVAELLRASPKFSNTPIIFMTGVAMDQHEVFRGYELGAVDYIFKPVDSHVLRSKVGVFVELRRQSEVLRLLNESLEQRVLDGTRQLETEEIGRRRAEEERSQLELQLRQAQKLEAIGTLASGVAHDFNNLLMGISSCATLALAQLEPEHPVRRYLTEIKKSTDSGTSITRQLLAFSRKRETSDVVFEVNDVIRNAEQMLRRLLREDIDLTLSLAEGDSKVLSDPSQVEQILLNLAVNAQDAMPEGGRLEVSTELVEIDDETASLLDCSSGAHLRISVSDTGTGMSEATRSRVFEPFFTTKEVGKGTGLGLSTVYGIVKQTGGHIELTSALGKGTTFRILLPVSRQGLTLAPPSPRSVRPTHGTTVLLVEDDALVRMAVRYYLEEEGYHVIEANTGARGLEVWESARDRIGAVVTDTVLPGLSGPDLISRIKRLQPTLPTVLMSAHPAEWLINEGRIDAETRTLQKPFEKEALLERLEEALHASVTTSSGAMTRGAAILVVEDQSAARLAIVDFLSSCDFEVLAAADAHEALEKAKYRPVGVILTDYSLPGMNGDALARKVKQLWPNAAVLYMSGHSDLDPDPAGPVLTKPIELDAIVSRIECLIAAAPRDAN